MKKYIIILLIVLSFVITSCKKNNEVTVINEVINHDVQIGDLEKIGTLEEELQMASEIAIQSCVGITAKLSTSLVGGNEGSGVIIKKNNNDYFIITNFHVVGSKGSCYDQINVYLGNLDVTIAASVMSYNADCDLALLKITTEINLIPATIATKEARLGNFCIAVGCPYDMKQYYNTVTIGNISAVNRTLEETSLNDNQTLVSNTYLQHDALINIGSSGGGLFNLKGELIGINTSKITKQSENIEGMSFAIPNSVIINNFEFYLK